MQLQIPCMLGMLASLYHQFSAVGSSATITPQITISSGHSDCYNKHSSRFRDGFGPDLAKLTVRVQVRA